MRYKIDYKIRKFLTFIALTVTLMKNMILLDIL